MKKSLLIGASLLSFTVMNAQSNVPSQVINGVSISSISDNGKWIVGETGINSIRIINLETDQAWNYNWSGAENDEGYTTGTSRAISDEGVVAGEVSSVPSYWKGGKWSALKGYTRDSYGVINALVKAITPDGSMIVGGLGKGGSMYDDGDVQFLFPCVWMRNDNGTYGDPVWLPSPEKDLFGRVPQRVTCLAVSTDGKAIAAQMTDGSGYFHIPYFYFLNDNGEWEMKEMGMDLVNPRNVPLAHYPGDYYGPELPNYEDYLDDKGWEEFDAAYPAWFYAQEEAGYSGDMQKLHLGEFVSTFMSGIKKQQYLQLYNKFAAEYGPWVEQLDKYNSSFDQLLRTGVDFVMNNGLISPDGKYIYYTAEQGTPGNLDVQSFLPVRIEVATGASQLYPNPYNLVLTSVTADYTVLAAPYSQDGDLYREAYLYPQGDGELISVVDYFKDNAPVYNWLEEHCYQSVVVSATGTSETFDDEWCLGMPYATPDMSLIGMAASTLYWQTPPDPRSNFITFLLNTNGNEEDGVEAIVDTNDATVSALPGGGVALAGDFSSLTVYDLSGTRVFHALNPSGTISTGLSSGVYVINAVKASGESINIKAIF